MNYLKGWFVIDFVSAIPVYIFLFLDGYGNVSRVPQLARLFRLFRLLRLFRMLTILRILNRFAELSE
ncbi:hypothetical protein PINS_up022520 [Pythium insidiosum]|nr:hypothetical protein PINS_up022520 [Pythium insidiosum]